MLLVMLSFATLWYCIAVIAHGHFFISIESRILAQGLGNSQAELLAICYARSSNFQLKRPRALLSFAAIQLLRGILIYVRGGFCLSDVFLSM
jgi:hypothetical protein